jgi:hypothetical protein
MEAKMQWQSPLIVMLFFVLRLALPLFALLGIGYLYERYIAPRFFPPSQGKRPDARVPTTLSLGQAASQQGYAAEAAPCWELRKCTPEQMAQCAVPGRSGVPCWLTRQIVESQLPEECLGCEIFQNSSHTQADDYVL